VSPGLSLQYPEAPVGALLAGSARRYGTHTTLHYYGRELDSAGLYARACAFANALGAAGIGRGDVVAIHLPNCPQYAIAYYGILLAGATFSPTNPLLPPPDLAAQLADCGAVAAVSWRQAAPALAAVQAGTAVRLVLLTDRDQALDPTHRVALDAVPGAQDFEAFHADAPTTDPAVPVDVHTDLAHLAYTGGTTGVSKGVELPHRNVVTNVLQSACWTSGSVPELDAEGDVTVRQIGPEEEYRTKLGEATGINLTPWFHAMGAIGYLNGQVMSGSTVVIHDRFDPVKYVEDAVRYRVSGIGGAPPIFVALLQVPGIEDADLSSVKGISSGAAPLPVPLIEKLKALLPDATIGEGYGLTEVTMMATGNPSFRSGTRKAGTVGVPIFDTEITIRPIGGGDPLPAGERGEVCIRGPQVMRGYAHRPEATAESIDADGWFHSGDVGILDEDGYLSIVDRTKDMLLYKGYNVFPRELEEILFGLPGVAGAAVVGRPDEEAGELPVAYVVRKPDDAGAALTAESIMAAVNEHVVHYKRLRDVVFIDAIPVSAAGKVLKRELAAREREAAEA
jgi:long-chain acyl-CoA synthetase